MRGCKERHGSSSCWEAPKLEEQESREEMATKGKRNRKQLMVFEEEYRNGGEDSGRQLAAILKATCFPSWTKSPTVDKGLNSKSATQIRWIKRGNNFKTCGQLGGQNSKSKKEMD